MFLCFQNPSEMTTKVQIEKVNSSNVPLFHFDTNTVGTLVNIGGSISVAISFIYWDG